MGYSLIYTCSTAYCKQLGDYSCGYLCCVDSLFFFSSLTYCCLVVGVYSSWLELVVIIWFKYCWLPNYHTFLMITELYYIILVFCRDCCCITCSCCECHCITVNCNREPSDSFMSNTTLFLFVLILYNCYQLVCR